MNKNGDNPLQNEAIISYYRRTKPLHPQAHPAQQWPTLLFAGDGNLHLNITSEKYDQELQDRIEPYLFEYTHKLRGSVSAEHGIGFKKTQFLHFSKTEPSINLMKNIKKMIDPKGILNPYKVLPLEWTCF